MSSDAFLQPTNEQSLSSARSVTRRSGRGGVLKALVWIIVLLIVGGVVVWGGLHLFKRPSPGQNPMAMGGGVPVTLSDVQLQTVEDSSDYLAEITSDNATTIHSQVSGRIQRVLVTDGQSVQAGQPLFQLDTSEQAPLAASLEAAGHATQAEIGMVNERIASLKAERVGLQTTVDFQRKQTQRYVTLSKTNTVSAKDLEQVQTTLSELENRLASLDASIGEQQSRLTQVNAAVQREQNAAASAKAQLAFFTVKAPYSGTVGDVWAKVGDVVDTNVPLTTVTNRNGVEVSVAVPAQLAHRLKVGIPLLLKAADNHLLGRTIIAAVMPSADPASQTVVVKGQLSQLPDALKVDERVKLAIVWGEHPAVVVPASAVLRMAGQSFVYTVLAQSSREQQNQEVADDSSQSNHAGAKRTAHLRPVTLGRMAGDGYVVSSGLKPGDVIVTGGIQKLRGDGVPIMELPPEKASDTPNPKNSKSSAQ